MYLHISVRNADRDGFSWIEGQPKWAWAPASEHVTFFFGKRLFGNPVHFILVNCNT
jgi:hypothetical protein